MIPLKCFSNVTFKHLFMRIKASFKKYSNARKVD